MSWLILAYTGNRRHRRHDLVIRPVIHRHRHGRARSWSFASPRGHALFRPHACTVHWPGLALQKCINHSTILHHPHLYYLATFHNAVTLVPLYLCTTITCPPRPRAVPRAHVRPREGALYVVRACVVHGARRRCARCCTRVRKIGGGMDQFEARRDDDKCTSFKS